MYGLALDGKKHRCSYYNKHNKVLSPNAVIKRRGYSIAVYGMDIGRQQKALAERIRIANASRLAATPTEITYLGWVRLWKTITEKGKPSTLMVELDSLNTVNVLLSGGFVLDVLSEKPGLNSDTIARTASEPEVMVAFSKSCRKSTVKKPETVLVPAVEADAVINTDRGKQLKYCYEEDDREIIEVDIRSCSSSAVRYRLRFLSILTLQVPGKDRVHIYNVYRPGKSSDQRETNKPEPTPEPEDEDLREEKENPVLELLTAALQEPGEYMNLPGYIYTDDAASRLLDITIDKDLGLLLPERAVIYEKGDARTTIDLI
ncbi:uncharacterized protein BO95DRAFT_431524 [Aspergillus brunneoviolaceus CBS 621.78]|uniref:Uncharacterized protein n=1 Tax=Aspergillus brunneoviolaceus CBS 621.78 TaxID=1450534 RepID=A0ACD1GAN4_9EURO|nr:hypothetical protein BO95DRAFT_431524 [Aspergillus brunneoviolaceus CBS 621.78]RAH46270.1 hypothetical protein BO95DRAFT_431524 [Aspergillus brunneoviolaceus CBS 621.78]